MFLFTVSDRPVLLPLEAHTVFHRFCPSLLQSRLPLSNFCFCSFSHSSRPLLRASSILSTSPKLAVADLCSSREVVIDQRGHDFLSRFRTPLSSILLLAKGPAREAARALVRGTRTRRRAARSKADARDIKDRFRDAIQSEVLLDQRVAQCRRAEGSQSQPRGREAKRLTEMAGLEQNDSIGARPAVFPHGSRKDRRHDEKRRRLAEIRLSGAIRGCRARRC